MFTLIAIHNDTALCFQLPCALVHIEHNHVHTQIARCLLSAQAGTQAVVEENQQASLMLSQILILIAVFLISNASAKAVFKSPKSCTFVKYLIIRSIYNMYKFYLTG